MMLSAARWTARGTHEGMLQGPMGSIPATNRPVMFQGITMGRVVGGKARESWVLMDQLGLLRQIGTDTDAQAQ
jgi:predicted ester cyclase